MTPTFFINGRRYDGPWDEAVLADAMLGSLGHRVRSGRARLRALGAVGRPAAAARHGDRSARHQLAARRQASSGSGSSRSGSRSPGTRFALSLLHWVNDGLLTIFFLVVGLEIKREFTVGHLASAAIGGAAHRGAPSAAWRCRSLLYRAGPAGGPWAHGWGVPMATDTAFAVALIVMMGSRVPVELRVFLTAASIVDDIGAIVVVALFYSSALHVGALLAAVVITATAGAPQPRRRLSRDALPPARPRALGLRRTRAGCTRRWPASSSRSSSRRGRRRTSRALTAQASAIIATEARRSAEVLRRGPSADAMRALDAIHDRLESPADRLLRTSVLRSSYVVLPVFALANAGVALSPDLFARPRRAACSRSSLGLVVGKPLGLRRGVRAGRSPGHRRQAGDYSWRQLLGAGALAGIGFTMSLFIAGQAFSAPADFAAAKMAVFAASVISAALGVGILWSSNHRPR